MFHTTKHRASPSRILQKHPQSITHFSYTNHLNHTSSPTHNPLRFQLFKLLPLLFLFAIIDIYNWGIVLPHITYHPYRKRWVKILTAREWHHKALLKSSAPRYSFPRAATSFPFFPIVLLSLPRARDRRAHAVSQLASQNITYDVFDAIDGDDLLINVKEEEVLRFTSGERLAKYRRGTPNARYKIACDLSHYRLMQRLVQSGEFAQLVLEDDFQFNGNVIMDGGFLGALEATLRTLPSDWDVLHLNLCQLELLNNKYDGDKNEKRKYPVRKRWWMQNDGGVEVAPPVEITLPAPRRNTIQVKLFIRGFCTLGMLYTRKAAISVLHEAEKGTRNVDNVLMDLVEIGELNSYIVDPPFVIKAEQFKSLIDPEDQKLDPF